MNSFDHETEMLSVEERKRLQRRLESRPVAPSARSRDNRASFTTLNKSCLSPQVKESVLNLKKISDPFHPQVQRMFDDFIDHVDNSSQTDVDLSEVGLLLAGVTKIYSAQVDAIVEDIHNLVAYVTKTTRDPNDQKKRGRHKSATEDKDINASETEEKIENEKRVESDVVIAAGSNIPGEVCCKVELEDISEDPGITVVNADNNPSANPSDNVLVNESDSNSASVECPSSTVPEILVPDNNTTGDNGINLIPSECTPDELKEQILSEIPGPNTRKRSHLLENILQLDENGEPVKKKPRNGFSLPPTLISCFDELKQLELSGQINTDEDDCMLLPPVLEMAIRMSRKRNLFYTEDTIKDPKKFKDIIFITQPMALPVSADINGGSAVEVPNDMNGDSTIEVPGESIPNDTNPSLNIVPDASTIPINPFCGIPPIPSNAHTFSAEDQTAIQECINELHYLPFTFELSKSDLAAAFSRTVERMSCIFQKNNVQVTRSMMKDSSVIVSPVAQSPEKPSGSNGIVHPPAVAHSLGDIYTAFVKNCREECELFINTENTILEPTKEKSFAESRANIRAMISELQRNIVPKFSRVPLMAENTPEFFLQVTNFEKKMKKILEEEAKKEEFDVRKYEREVLEVTAKESSELDRMSVDLQMPQSPLKPQSIDGDTNDGIQASPSTRSSFDGSHSSFGSSWVPIKHIFQHMKSIDKTEAARLFYAVLALLSYQNLDINYDQLYSKESAALISKQLTGRGKEEEMDGKFRRGVKIMNSRCPDVDKEEVYVAALTTESRDEAFRHLLAQESNKIGIQSGAPNSNRNNTTLNGFDEGIAEAMADFVEESGSIFSGRLEGRKRKKKPES